MKKFGILASAAVCALGIFGTSSAALIDAEVPEDAYITKNGYDIAWISPVDEDYYLDFSYQSQFGWEVMTLDMFNYLDIKAQDFVKDGANVDYATGNNYDEASGANLQYVISATPQNDVAIAAPYFSTMFAHADWSNGVDGYWNVVDDSWIYETLAFRKSASVPEPATFGMLVVGLLGFAFSRKRAAKKSK